MKKATALILAAIISVSVLSLSASAYAMPFMNWRMGHYGMGPGYGYFFPSVQSYVRTDGIVTKWGTTNVTGTIQAQSRTVVLNSTTTRQGASANVIWTTNASRPLVSYRTLQNFTYTFYAARLDNMSVSSLNVTGYSFFLNGTWTVYKVNSVFTVNTSTTGAITGFGRSQNAAAIATQAYGELKVVTNSSAFTLSITGIDTLNGAVRVQRVTTGMFNPFIVNNETTQTTVTKADVASIVSAYGSSPGWGHYDQRMDYNFNYKVDLCDLATAAANVNV